MWSSAHRSLINRVSFCVFKQKTAYEIYQCDWSSDVCSSDLITAKPFRHAPRAPGASGGDIMEGLCSEVLTNHGIPHMDMDDEGWPVWASKAHVSLNYGKLRALKLYGDILIPAAPHN